MSITTFHAVNSAGLAKDAHMEDTSEVTTPTTPKAQASQIPPHSDPKVNNTPLRISSATPPPPTDISLQRPFSDNSSNSVSTSDLSQETVSQSTSQRSTQSRNGAEMEVDGSEDDQDGSGDETEGGDSGRPSKKKKGQRFFCTDFPPCSLSFTRSEHLARHIRKHTGERPFQCHCNRRFSRLDNLRQHAQTVHVNEEIPGDSLAATGTRFQRQIRTDRVRAPGRARSGTGGNQAAHSRGHSRNLSTSSIGSTSSNFSTVQEATKRRPPPLIMANDSGRARLSLDTNTSPPGTPPNQFSGFSAQSPGGFSTPTSATVSTGPASPSFGSSYGSPASSRNPSYYGARTPGRRLSVPTGANPFQSPHGNTHPPPYLTPLASSTASFSTNGSVFGSPTSSNFSFVRGDPNAVADAEWRRRTWHPSTYSAFGGGFNSRPATSSLSYSQTPDAPQPAFAPNATAAASHAPRLPGIESFDQVQHRPSTPPRRRPSPMQIDAPTPASSQVPHQIHNGQTQPRRLGHHRGHISWDIGLHNRLSQEPQKEFSQWGQQTINEIEHVGSQLQVRGQQPVPTSGPAHPVLVQAPSQPTFEVPQNRPATPQRNKRHGWYNGPLSTSNATNLVPRTSPEDSSSSEGVPTPGTSAAEYHPAIVHSNGYIEAQHPSLSGDASSHACIPQQPSHPQPAYPLQQSRSAQANYFTPQAAPTNDMGRLEALVAVATSEEKAATAAR